MAGVFVHLLTVNPEKTPQYGGAATFMVFLVGQNAFTFSDCVVDLPV